MLLRQDFYDRPLGDTKASELQALVYRKLILQGKLRGLARLVSYLIPVGCFAAITLMYMWKQCSSRENTLYIVGMLVYIILIHDPVLNTGFQFAALQLTRRNTPCAQRYRKLAMRLILKEVKELIRDDLRDQSQNSGEKGSSTVEVLRSMNSMMYMPGAETSPMCKQKGCGGAMLASTAANPQGTSAEASMHGRSERESEEHSQAESSGKKAGPRFEVNQVYVQDAREGSDPPSRPEMESDEQSQWKSESKEEEDQGAEEQEEEEESQEEPEEDMEQQDPRKGWESEEARCREEEERDVEIRPPIGSAK